MTEATPRSASFFAQVSRELMDDVDEPPTYQTVVRRAVDVVPTCDWASITLRRRRNRTETVAFSAEVAQAADQLQYDLDEGPCLAAVRSSEPRLSNHLKTSTEWPRWGPRVAEVGVHSILGVPLSTNAEVLGALNLYSSHPASFTEEDIDLAVIYATHATNALNAARTATGLRTAVQTRHLIGIAQGILMLVYDLGQEQSFELLRRYSSHTNTKLGEVARHVVEHRSLPDYDAPRG